MNIPEHLSQDYAVGEKSLELVAQYEIGNYQNFVYLILDWSSRKAVIIDPQLDLSAPLNCIIQNGFELEAVLLTHTHFDHVAGVPGLLEKFPEIPVFVHSEDSHRLPATIKKSLRPLSHGQSIQVGTLQIDTLHTPGHSAGECCFFLKTNPPYLFTGDTLFIRDCGRTDLPTGSNDQMFQSLQKIRMLPPETIILPGHHYKSECASTLKKELLESPPFRCRTVEELAALP